jgi:hypothetical protein
MLAGGDGIDDADLLGGGATSQVLGHRVMAPSTLGTFLPAFTFGQVRQLDRVCEQLLTRAWAAGAGPGDGPMTMDLDSTVCQAHGDHQQGPPPAPPTPSATDTAAALQLTELHGSDAGARRREPLCRWPIDGPQESPANTVAVVEVRIWPYVLHSTYRRVGPEGG